MLIEDFEKETIGKLDRRQTPADPFDQNGISNVTKNCPVWRPHRADDIGNQPLIRQARMNR